MTTENQSAYDIIGGEQGVRRLVDIFYDYMDELQEVKQIRSLHAKSLKASREKLFLFLSGWLGGPDLYVQKYGHPMLRRRHLPFAIGVQERDEWMLCMKRALSDMQLEPTVEQQLLTAFMQTANHMRNKPEYDEDQAGLKIMTPNN
jgi:hemoglobin